MRKAALAVLAAAAVLFAASLPAAAITFGQLDGNAHPNVGGLVAEFSGAKSLICSGTLISPTVFLTAAHCTAYLQEVGIPVNEVYVTFDPVFDSKNGTFLKGTYHSDPLYGHDNSDPHDIAVVVLDNPVANVTPAQLPAADELDALAAKAGLKNQEFTAVGYGGVRDDKTGGWHPISYDDQRRFVTQSFLSLTPSWLRLSENISTGSGGTCYGDSGGPHFLGGVTSNKIVATTITGDANCRATDTDYRLDTVSARTFLSEFVALP